MREGIGLDVSIWKEREIERTSSLENSLRELP